MTRADVGKADGERTTEGEPDGERTTEGDPGDGRSDESNQSGAQSAVGRRQLLRAVGAGALATSVAGCQQVGQQSYEFTADPVVLGESSRSEQGYTEAKRETVTVERTESVSGVEADVTVDSQVAIYASERDTEPLDEAGLWAADDSVLAAWTGGQPMRGVRASEVVDGETLSARSGGLGVDTLPADAAQVWVPTPKFGDAGPEDVLVAVPSPKIGIPNPQFGGRDTRQFEGRSFFPGGAVMDYEDGLYIPNPKFG